MIKRTIGIALMVVLVSGSATVAGAAGQQRVERSEFLLGGVQGVLGVDAHGQFNTGSVRLPAGSEKWVSVEVTNAGTPIYGEVTQDFDGVLGPELAHEFCGATGGPVRIRPNYPVTVYLYNGVCSGNSPSIVTTGEVVATFTASR